MSHRHVAAESAANLTKPGHPNATSAIPPHKTVGGGRLFGFTI